MILNHELSTKFLQTNHGKGKKLKSWERMVSKYDKLSYANDGGSCEDIAWSRHSPVRGTIHSIVTIHIASLP